MLGLDRRVLQKAESLEVDGLRGFSLRGYSMSGQSITFIDLLAGLALVVISASSSFLNFNDKVFLAIWTITNKN